MLPSAEAVSTTGMLIGFALKVGLAVVVLTSDFGSEKLLFTELLPSEPRKCNKGGGDLMRAGVAGLLVCEYLSGVAATELCLTIAPFSFA
mmetsp:Transcript_2266/g.4681  ORF Transcript_2266/g.4681 Transcript_2266/m.4681 type:complete len:90 (-) Transcript_2266:289-558(-)